MSGKASRRKRSVVPDDEVVLISSPCGHTCWVPGTRGILWRDVVDGRVMTTGQFNSQPRSVDDAKALLSTRQWRSAREMRRR